MARLSVLHFPDPGLRKRALAVESIDDELRQLAQDMLETMYEQGGIGLAATQVNVQKRLIVMDLSADKSAPMILINPEILGAEGRAEMQEGCLSVPGFYENIERAEIIDYQYLTPTGARRQARAEGLLAVCIQHEIDHLDGRLFIDYLSPLKRQRLQKKLQKQARLDSLAL